MIRSALCITVCLLSACSVDRNPNVDVLASERGDGGWPLADGGDAGECSPSPEVCDNRSDDDCDGSSDEGCACEPGSSRQCYAGPEGTERVAACRAGEQRCEDGSWGTCRGAVLPSPQRCAGQDDDCDGAVDEGCDCDSDEMLDCYGGAAGTLGIGACRAGTQACRGGRWGGCVGAQQPSEEMCDDGSDDDCDGAVDEGWVCDEGDRRACFTGATEQRDVGRCSDGEQTCDGDSWGGCSGAVLPADEERCDGELDDDCDGAVDEGCDCESGSERPCYSGTDATRDVGECDDGVQRCVQGVWGTCEGDTAPAEETCDGLDNDCDGERDEDNPGGGDACETGDDGECSIGVMTCAMGELTCRPLRQPRDEQCDALDDDCDGELDEDFRSEEGDYVHDAHCGGCDQPCGDTLTGADAEQCVSGETGPRCEATDCAAGHYLRDGSCIAATLDACAACESDDDCPTPGDACIDIGSARVCGYDCSEGNLHGTAPGECPSGFACSDLGDPGEQCVPTSGACDCLPETDGSTRPCSISNDFGTCGGIEICDAAVGWSSCDAAAPIAELCDGVDNDCDGTVDDGNPEGGATCETGEPGVCGAGTQVCGDGELACEQDREAADEDTCGNGLDDNCDGVVDEGCCAHSACEAGEPLPTTCSACANTICVVGNSEAGVEPDPYCCETEWDSVCVERALAACDLACDCDSPLDPGDSCEAGERCRPTPGGVGVCEHETGDGTQGASCTSTSECAPDHLCASSVAGGYLCNRYCRVGSDNDCEDGTSCWSLDPPVYIGDIEWGACDLPP